MSHPVSSFSVLSQAVSSCLTLSHPVPSCLTLFCHVSSCLVIFRPVSGCLVLFHPVSSPGATIHQASRYTPLLWAADDVRPFSPFSITASRDPQHARSFPACCEAGFATTSHLLVISSDTGILSTLHRQQSLSLKVYTLHTASTIVIITEGLYTPHHIDNSHCH